jgi:xanthine dehydrogenase small subunit
VAIGELSEGRVNYRSVNACILLLPMLEGRSVTTVEHLASAKGPLHPAQEALVDLHGSQCGFCTPGIVMSLYVTYVSEPKPDIQRINDVLAGNLCRCTGYGPILNAAQAMYELPEPPGGADRRALESGQLRAIANNDTVLLEGAGCRLYAPASLADLADLVEQHPDATILSGATDVGLWITKLHRQIGAFIYTGRVGELRTVVERSTLLRIGAGATISEIERTIGRYYCDFGELLRRFGSAQVRNVATIGGNIANGSPIGDFAPALIALGAALVLRKGRSRRSIPLETFFIAYGKQHRRPGEFVEAIEVPLIDDPQRFKCYKVSKRFDQDISTVCGCFNINVAGGSVRHVRICYGGMGGTPKRAFCVETALNGRPWTRASVMAALSAFDRDFTPITDMRGSAAYRSRTAKNLLIRYFHETQVPPQQTRLVGCGAAFS